ncbi:MAG: hypothetical protein ABIJ21_04050 [Nanoarchaeota archaeon]
MDIVLELLLKKIKKKRELTSLDDVFIAERVNLCFLIYPKLKKALYDKNPKTVVKSREFNDVVKFVRKDLREVYGIFIMDGFDKKKVDMPDSDLLRLHRSTRERLPFYDMFYQQIFEHLHLQGHSHLKVVDLGCGLNPVSYKYLNHVAKMPIRYIATEIAAEDVAFLNAYFTERKINGHAVKIDLTDEDQYPKIPLDKDKDTFLVCFLFKLIDTFEATKRHTSKKLIAFLAKRADALVITFPTKSIGGRNSIEENKRWWLEGFLQNNNLQFEKFELGGEMVFVVNCT